jgi:hypothetical protein
MPGMFRHVPMCCSAVLGSLHCRPGQQAAVGVLPQGTVCDTVHSLLVLSDSIRLPLCSCAGGTDLTPVVP